MSSEIQTSLMVSLVLYKDFKESPARRQSCAISHVILSLRIFHVLHDLQVSYDDFKEFASLRKELHKLQVALEFYQKTTGQFGLEDLKVHFACSSWPDNIHSIVAHVLHKMSMYAKFDTLCMTLSVQLSIQQEKQSVCRLDRISRPALGRECMLFYLPVYITMFLPLKPLSFMTS